MGAACTSHRPDDFGSLTLSGTFGSLTFDDHRGHRAILPSLPFLNSKTPSVLLTVLLRVGLPAELESWTLSQYLDERLKDHLMSV